MTTLAQSKWERIRLLFIHRELIAMLLLLTAAIVCAWPETRGMATASLWQDELWSVERYSAKGPLFTMTTYREPNNHIFFNVLNALTPGPDRFHPLRARFWSFIFVILTAALLVLCHVSARRPFDGGLLAFLLLANIPHLDLLLQARGYGFLAFAALTCTLFTWQYFRRPSLAPLVGIPLMVWLGTWTVPTFVLFGAPLFLILLIYTRDWRWLVSGGSALTAIVLVYWPVRIAILHNSTTYATEWGKEFANWNAISDLFSTYLLFGMGNWFTFLVVILVTVGFSRISIQSPQEKASLCVGLSILLTFVLCLKMETPGKRTVAFTLFPFAFMGITLFSRLLRGSTLGRFKGLIMAAILVAVFAFAHASRRTFHFTPMEAWLETARKIEDRFPKGTEIVAQFRPQWLKVYISADYPVVQTLDQAKFLAGKQIVVDSSFWAKSRFPSGALPKGHLMETVAQRRGGMQRIYFAAEAQKSSRMIP